MGCTHLCQHWVVLTKLFFFFFPNYECHSAKCDWMNIAVYLSCCLYLFQIAAKTDSCFNCSSWRASFFITCCEWWWLSRNKSWLNNFFESVFFERNIKYLLAARETYSNHSMSGVDFNNTKCRRLNAQMLAFKCQMSVFSISNFILQLLVFKMPKTGVNTDDIGVLTAKISGV